MHRTRRRKRPGGEKGPVHKHASPDYGTYEKDIVAVKWFVQTLPPYVTWKRTSFPVPKGSRKRNVIAAIIAQKKLTRGFRMKGNPPVPEDDTFAT